MKKYFYTTIFVLAFLFSGYSQVQIGSGTNNAQNLPVNPASYFTYSQSIYLASEINATGTVTTLQWYYAGSGTLANSQGLTIYMGLTSKSSFASSNDWIPYANLTTVYTGGLQTFSTPGWKSITLTTPFVLDGVNNLVIATDENASGNDSGYNKFFNTQVSGNRSIGFYNNSTNPDPSNPPTTGSTFYMVSYVPSLILGDAINQICATPLNFTMSKVQHTTATISWQPSKVTPSGGSDYYVSTSNTTPTDSTTPTGSISFGNSVDLSSLTPNTTHYVWIRNNCGSGVYSGWSEMTVFTTPCSPIASFSESFDTTIIPNIPNCWTKILRGSTLASAASIKTQASNYNSASNSVSLNNSNSTGTYDIILASPNLSTLSLGIYRLKFYAKSSGSTGNIEVGTLNSNQSDAIFSPLESVAVNSTMTQYTIDFHSYTGTDTFIGIRHSSPITNSVIYLDDIQWQYTPNCPDVTQLTVPFIAPNLATVNWVSMGGDSFDVVMGNANTTDPSTLTPINTPNSFYTFNNLTSSTTYKVWVRSVCTSTGNGDWILPVTFKTDCDPVTSFTEYFDSVTTPNLPNCWSKIMRGPGLGSNPLISTISNSNSFSGTNALMLSNSNSTGTYDIIAVSPNVSTLGLGTYRLRFAAKGLGTLEIGTLDTNTSQATFTSYQSISTTSSYATYVLDFTGYISTDTHVGIRSATIGGGNTIYLDNIIWEIAPLCPDVTHINVPTVTSTGADILWQAGGDETVWEVVVGPTTITDPNLLIPSSTIASTFSVTNLNPTTNYYVWVRSICGANKGSWVGPILFTTECLALSEFSENFDYVTVPALPSCWTKILRGTTLDANAVAASVLETSLGSFSTPSAKLFNGSSKATDDIILISPPIVPATLANHRLRFTVKGKGDPYIQIGTLDSNTSSGVFTKFKDIHVTSSEVEYKIDFSTYTDGVADHFIGIRLSSLDYDTAYIDNIYWEPNPLCADVTNIKLVAVTTTSATFSWAVQGTESKWDVAVGTLDVTDLTTLTPQTALVNSYEYMNLIPATSYNVWVRSHCDAVNGDWIGPVRFNTDCLPVDSFNEGFNVTPYPYLPPCWTSIVRGTAAPTSGAFNTLTSPLAAHSKPGYVTVFSDNSPAGADVILVGPNISSLSQATDYTLSFYASGSNTLEIGTLDLNTDSAVFTKVTELNVQGIGGGDNKTLHVVDMSTAKPTDHYIGFKITTGYMGGSQQYISMDDIQWTRSLGKKQFDLSKFTYYPNPVKDIMTISYDELISRVTVSNLLGQEIFTDIINQNEAKINMTSLPSGPYLVKVSSNDYVKVIKVVKE